MESINFEKRQGDASRTRRLSRRHSSPHRSPPAPPPRQARRRAVRRARAPIGPRRGRQARTAPRTPQRLPHARPTAILLPHTLSPSVGRQDHRQGPPPPRVGDRAARPREEGRRRRRRRRRGRGGAAEGEGEARGAMTDRDGTAERRDRVSGLFDAKQHHGHRPAAGARERLARAAWHTCRNVCRVNGADFFTLPASSTSPSSYLGRCTAHTLDTARARSG